ncbi:MAG: pyridine nucleotide-disulfide oxidoreductase [Armatimonadota bacterium]|nr:MAG: pyridine nucleotide-disulfide oxidoreductase [Armatimonadota bacterium]
MSHTHVVVLGAGFGGLSAVKVLAQDRRVRVTVIDRNNYHLFQPLLYQVAIAGLEAPQVAWPIRAMFRRYPNARFWMGSVESVDPIDKRVWVDGKPVSYDYLVVSLGSTSHDYGIPGVRENAIPLKSLGHAMAIRDRVLSAVEEAVRTAESSRRQALLTFVVVGGGPTGVELAGALAELKRHVLVRDYPEIAPEEMRIVLIEAGDRLLGYLSPESSVYTRRTLEQLGVTVLTGCAVSEVTPFGVYLRGGSFIPSYLVIWTAGVRGMSLPGLPEGSNGRIPTTPELYIPETPDIYVVGDLNGLMVGGKPLPQVAPLAKQQGAWAARNILRRIHGHPELPFRYRDKGNLVTIGRNHAVGEVRGVRFTGRLAWLTWLAVHIYYLTGLRNRLMVLGNWIYSYLTYDFAVRVIHRKQHFPYPSEEETPLETAPLAHLPE